MSETISMHQTPETLNQPEYNHRLVSELLSDTGKQTYYESITEEIEHNPAYQHFHQVETDYRTQKQELVDNAGVILDGKEAEYYEGYDEYIERKELAEQLWGEAAADEFHELFLEKQALEQGRLHIQGQKGAALLEELIAHHPEPITHSAHQFIHPSRLDALRPTSQEDGSLTIGLRRSDEPVELPTSLFISAEGMDSWYGRGEQGQAAKNAQTSHKTIQEYARDYDQATVEDLSAYVLPDGRIYFKSNNAHRLAAAIWRGDETVQFQGGATIYALDRVPPELEI